MSGSQIRTKAKSQAPMMDRRTPPPNSVITVSHGFRSLHHATMRPLQLSIVLPCLNEALTLGQCIDQAKHALEVGHLDGEIIVADNGSTDGSREIAITTSPRTRSMPSVGKA